MLDLVFWETLHSQQVYEQYPFALLLIFLSLRSIRRYLTHSPLPLLYSSIASR